MPSFFNFFKDPKEVEEDEEEEDDDGEKIPTHLDVEEDYEIAHAIRTSLIPEAILWYSGENAEEEDYDDDYYRDGDDDDDDGDEPPQLTLGKGGGKNGTAQPSLQPEGPGPNGEKPPECKQN